jgi:mono/diheme cytochrome c family protein
MKRSVIHLAAVCGLALCVPGCWRENMGSQPKDKPYQQSDFFADGASARPAVVGAVAREDEFTNSTNLAGVNGAGPVSEFPQHYPGSNDPPFPTRGPELRAVLQRGAQLFAINCVMCHGESGDGLGIVVQRGFPHPPNYQLNRLRTAPVGHFYDVITNGYGAMYSFDDKISPADRWTIVAYIRTLQLSQGTPAQLLSDAQRQKLQEQTR